MRESSILPFNSCNPGFKLTKDSPFCKKPVELLLLFMEHSSNYIMAIVSLLILQKFIGNLRPLRITGKCKERVYSSKLSNISHCILSPLMHISGSSHIAWRQDALLSNALVWNNTWNFYGIMHGDLSNALARNNGILEVYVIIYP